MVAPTQAAVTVAQMEGEWVAAERAWGLTPHWATRPLINAMAELHHRMPAILDHAAAEAWLDPATTPADLQALLRPCPDGWIEAHEVGPAVGNARVDRAELIRAVG